jgi:NitT/TauT family transport system permease protein
MNDSAKTSGPSTQSPRRFASWFKRSRTIRDAPSYKEGLIFGVVCVGLVLLVWWILTRGEGADRIVDPYSLPSPEGTLASFRSLWFERELSLSAVISLGRVLGGFLLAAAIGVPLGLIAGSYLRVNAFFRPLTVFGRSVPVAALIPLAMMWFGLGEFNKVMFIFIATVAFVLFDSTNAAQSVPDRCIDPAYTLGAQRSPKKGVRFAAIAGLIYGLVLVTGWRLLREDVPDTFFSEMVTPGFWLRFAGGFAAGFLLWFPIAGHQVMRKVILPLAMPGIVNNLRLTFGLAFGYIMLAEVVNAKSGIGALINNSQRIGPREHVYLCLVIISLLAWGIDRGIMALQRHLFPYLKNAQA